MRAGEKEEAPPLVRARAKAEREEVAAVVRAAEVVVFGSAGAEQPVLQHSRRGEAGGEIGPRVHWRE